MPTSKPAEEFSLAECVVVCWKEGEECVWHPELESLMAEHPQEEIVKERVKPHHNPKCSKMYKTKES